MSSSGDDSETAEWEREQMLRGTQSRRQKCQEPRTELKKDTIDATVAKSYVNQDIARAERSIETVKRSIGGARLELAKSEKRLEALRKRIEVAESVNSFFEELSNLDDPNDVLALLDRNRAKIASLSHDQREMIELLEQTSKSSLLPAETTPMET